MNRFMSVICLAATALSMAACTPVPSGQKNGTITKLARQGLFVPTWEAEIVRGGSFTGGTGVQGAAFDFTISDPALLTKINNAFKNQQEVRITYHQSWPSLWTSDNGGNFLDSIEVIDESQGGTITETRGAVQQTPAPTSPTADPRFNQLLEQNQAILKQNQKLLETLAQK